jgi:hypothetical protein
MKLSNNARSFRPALLALPVIVAVLSMSSKAQAGVVSGPLSGALNLVKAAVTAPFYVLNKATQGVQKSTNKSSSTTTSK